MNKKILKKITAVGALSIEIIATGMTQVSALDTIDAVKLSCGDYGCSHGYHTMRDYYLLSSSNEKHGTRYYYLSSSFSSTEKTYLYSAVARWQSLPYFNVIINLEKVNNPSDKSCINIEPGTLGANTLGLTYHKDTSNSEYDSQYVPKCNFVAAKCVLDTEQISSYTELVDVCVHEMGHAFGLMHVTCRNSIMYPAINSSAFSSAITNDDMMTLRHIYC